ncbi:sensor histidine kinase [Paenibacillus sp. GCM10027628]|uniref:cache domain-containing sensor histidine kinase n=1 Tax=Paenibacillus sp. GCM10027628 TaxID=3273413 RepID=UPI00364039D5
MQGEYRRSKKLTSDKLWVSFTNLSMQQKLLIVFLVLVTLPIMLVSYGSSYYYSRSIQTSTTAYATEITSNMMTKLDDYVTDLYNMSEMPLYNSDFLYWLEDPNMGLDKQQSMDLYVANLNKIKPDTVSVYVFDRYGNVYYNIKSTGIRSNLGEVKAVWEEMAQEGDGRPRLVSTQAVSTDDKVSTYYAFSVIRQLKRLSDMEPIGFIAFDTNINAINRTIQDVDQVTKGKTVLVDETNRVLYDSDQRMITRDLSTDESIRNATTSRGSFPIRMDGKSYICTYAKSALTNWKMFVYIPLEEATKQSTVTRNYTLLATIAFIAFASFIAIAISYALTRPLRKIKKLMQEVQLGNLDVRFNPKYRDEVGLLGKHFDTMIVRVQNLLDEVKFTQARKKEAEFTALQNQINPHFIYNTLEMIRMRAEINDDEEVAEMTFILGKLMRYGINHGNQIVTVRSELEHLNNYVILQNLRFSGKYKLTIDVPEELYDYPCMKLMFQPIVENSIHHAFKNKVGNGIIRIYGARQGMHIVFTVTDDGNGMDEQSLKTLREHISGIRLIQSGRGIGLRNVNERIKIQYGENYGLRVESKEEFGTAITIRLPENLMLEEVSEHA